MEPNIAFPAIYALNGVDYHQNAADRHACVIYGHRKLERRSTLSAIMRISIPIFVRREFFSVKVLEIKVMEMCFSFPYA
ncbi:MAG TPA: hypothetical protein IAB34_12490 [Candidatus Egerieimonas faecigallinarum]|nr:hypothetical protein [Candidatus Egerieimonas faecigallinarum]